MLDGCIVYRFCLFVVLGSIISFFIVTTVTSWYRSSELGCILLDYVFVRRRKQTHEEER